MKMDLHAKSQQLLETLANSIHDREKTNTEQFAFNLTDIHLTEKWLLAFEKELKKDCVCV